MKRTLFWLSLVFLSLPEAFPQIKWSNDTLPAGQAAWNNYSTSYLGDVSDAVPFLVTAIPYNGMYSNMGDINTPIDLSFEGSLFRFRSTLSHTGRRLYTYDSSEVYFLTPGIYQHNAAGYEYRVTLNAQTVITPWTPVNRFSNLALNTFKEGYGFLGGYKTTWGNYIIVELRKKGVDTILSSAVVYWKNIHPVVVSVYTSKNWDRFFTLLQRPWDKAVSSDIPVNNPVFSPAENNIVWYLSADIYKKEAVEYQLIKDGKVYSEWKPNDFDNSFIWLRELPPGTYQLAIRYSRQRHNVATWPFTIQPAWHQTAAFKIAAGSLIAVFFGSIVLLLRLQKARRKIEKERVVKEKLHLELKSIYSQLNPHFIFNSLNSIQGLINKNDLASANRYLSEFGNLLRHSLTQANKDFNTLDSEIVTLERYLKLEQLRFGFHYSIQTGDGINAVETLIPSLLLQPLLENAVKHGVASMQKSGSIQLSFIKENDDMRVVISDNGKGFNQHAPVHGHGLRLTRERIRLLNDVHNNKTIELLISDAVTPGTTIFILFKNWLS